MAPQNRPMTKEEIAGYGGAVSGYVLDAAEYRSRVWIAEPDEDGDPWLVYGDLRAAFDISDDSSSFGNVGVADLLAVSVDLDEVDLDPENTTFFAYAPTRERAERFVRDISDAVALHRERKSLSGRVSEAITAAIEAEGERIPAGIEAGAVRAIEIVRKELAGLIEAADHVARNALTFAEDFSFYAPEVVPLRIEERLRGPVRAYKAIRDRSES